MRTLACVAQDMTDSSIERRLAELGIALPRVPTPIATFVPYRREGPLVFLAGQVCELDGDVVHRGKLGRDLDVAAGKAAARICALNLLAVLRLACGGSLDAATGCIRLGGFVNCSSEFEDAPYVVNGASDLICEVFGERGRHARTAVGVAGLPRGAAVEVDAIFAVEMR